MNTKNLILGLLLLFFGSAFAAEQQPLVITLDWFVNPNHAPLFVAEQEGFFKQQGIEVKFIPPADTSEGEKMVAVNQADIAITYQPTLMYKVTNGVPLIRFATLINTPLNALIVLKSGPIHTIKDLKRKRIGISTPGTDNIMLATMLKTALLKPDDVELINVKFNLSQALLTSKIDGFTGGMRNFEPITMELAGKSIRMFYPEKYGFPMYDELILITNKNKINDPRLPKFIRALEQGVTYLQKKTVRLLENFRYKSSGTKQHLERKSVVFNFTIFCSRPCKIRSNTLSKPC